MPVHPPREEAGRPAFERWRDAKLRAYPRRAGDLVVEVRDPGRLSPAERDALAERLRRANMAVYAGPRDAGRDAVRALGRAFGLERLDAHWQADEDAISRIEVREGEIAGELIPYSSRPIQWHTDGYYHPPARTVRGMVLHCVRPAAQGGVNAVLDHEIAYALLRDLDEEHVRCLAHPQAMTIPERRDDAGVARAEQAGPVFSRDPATGRLHMRYTARVRSIHWREDAATHRAVQCLEALLAGPAAPVLHLRLEAGMGLLCANVLHNRSGFVDDPSAPRLLYRARYFDAPRIQDQPEGDAPCNSTRNSTRAASPARCPS